MTRNSRGHISGASELAWRALKNPKTVSRYNDYPGRDPNSDPSEDKLEC
jgi:hypothetical protein